MKEQPDSINQIIESVVKESNFEQVRNAIAEAHKMAIVAANMSKTVDAVTKAGQIAKILVAEEAKAKVMIAFQEQIKREMMVIENQLKELYQIEPLLIDRYKVRLDTETIWLGAFGEMYMDEIMALDTKAFRGRIGGFLERYYSEVLNDLSAGESKKQQSQQNELGASLVATVQKVLESSQQLNDNIFTGNTTDVKALYNVLKAANLIEGAYPEKRFAEFFDTHFNFKITGRTLQNNPNKGQKEKEQDYRKLLT